MADFLLMNGVLPDILVRAGVRSQLSRRLKNESKGGHEGQKERFGRLLDSLKSSPIAMPMTSRLSPVNELPAEFFEKVLGRGMKYSAGLWREGVNNLDLSESDMLETTLWRTDIRDGHEVLELGCGWGSFALLAAFRFPNCRITAVTNATVQKDYIEKKALERGLTNIRVLTADMNDLSTETLFDRVVSVEMFEHMRNYELLMKKVSSFLKPDGKLFIHLFCHQKFAYQLGDDRRDWVARYFLKGGVMPSENLLLYFEHDFAVESQWRISGTHYQKTCRAWLERMDSQRPQLMSIFREVYGPKQARRWWNIWRLFLISSEELFGYRNGQEWYVSHLLFRKRVAEIS